MKAVVVWTTVPSAKSARRLAQILLAGKLAACVSFREGFESVYRWKKKVETAKEVLVVIKSSKKALPALQRAVSELHPYELPEFLVFEAAGGSKKYLEWIQGCLE